MLLVGVANPLKQPIRLRQNFMFTIRLRQSGFACPFGERFRSNVSKVL